MDSQFDRMWRAAERRLDGRFAEPVELRPMAREDVNARPVPDGSRPVLASLLGVFEEKPTEVMLGDESKGAGLKHQVARTTIAIRGELLPFEVRVGDVIHRPASEQGGQVVRRAELYRVQAPGISDSGGRVVLPLARVLIAE